MSDSSTAVVGSRLLRKEDPELLTGEARFVDDLDLTGALWVACVRSPHAHARINSVDLSGALAADGVVAAYSGADLAESWGPLPCAWPVTDDMKNPAHLPIAVDKANYVGDVVAVVLADDRYGAADAASLVEVDYEPLDAVVDLEDALADGTVIHEDLGTNSSYTWELTPDADAVEAAFSAADHVVSRALYPAAAHSRGHGAAGGGSGARAVRWGYHHLLGYPDPPHPQGHGGSHPGPARAEGPGSGTHRWEAVSAPS